MLVGNRDWAKSQAQAALALSNGRDVVALSAIALALAGDSAHATRLADELGKRFPESTLVRFNYLSTVYAATLLWNSHATKAGKALAQTAAYELGGVFENLNFRLYPVYLRGEAR
jgi:hypothetical protein